MKNVLRESITIINKVWKMSRQVAVTIRKPKISLASFKLKKRELREILLTAIHSSLYFVCADFVPLILIDINAPFFSIVQFSLGFTTPN